MSKHEAVEALRALGLSNYEAQVFVALQQLGTGTAQEVGRHSEVPRSHVYGTAESLADRGLLEVVESSPKTFRPVDLETAAKQLRRDIERKHDRAFEHLESLQNERADVYDEGHVSTLRGRQPIYDRMVDLVGRANRQLVLIGANDEFVDETLREELLDRARADVFVMVVTGDQALERRLTDTPVRVVVSPADTPDGYTGRTLLVDEATVLLSVPTRDDETKPFEEVALWTAETSIGHILARFVHAGMEYGLNGEYPAIADP